MLILDSLGGSQAWVVWYFVAVFGSLFAFVVVILISRKKRKRQERKGQKNRGGRRGERKRVGSSRGCDLLRCEFGFLHRWLGWIDDGWGDGSGKGE